MQEDISFLCPTFKVVNVRREVSHHCLEGEHLFLRVLAFSDRAGRLTVEIQFLRAECHALDVLGKEESPVVILVDYPLLEPQRIVDDELTADEAVGSRNRDTVIVKQGAFYYLLIVRELGEGVAAELVHVVPGICDIECRKQIHPAIPVRNKHQCLNSRRNKIVIAVEKIDIFACGSLDACVTCGRESPVIFSLNECKPYIAFIAIDILFCYGSAVIRPAVVNDDTLDAFRHRLVGNRLQAFLDILLYVIYGDDDTDFFHDNHKLFNEDSIAVFSILYESCF